MALAIGNIPRNLLYSHSKNTNLEESRSSRYQKKSAFCLVKTKKKVFQKKSAAGQIPKKKQTNSALKNDRKPKKSTKQCPKKHFSGAPRRKYPPGTVPRRFAPKIHPGNCFGRAERIGPPPDRWRGSNIPTGIFFGRAERVRPPRTPTKSAGALFLV